ncbi:MAG: hypothetical protein K0U74_10330 [Alphaproteobacteria bacterium]|nr:hypothetical protein [Alphaproteobacteria bacterium]
MQNSPSPLRSATGCLVVTLAILATATSPVAAKTCSSDPVYASGEPSSYEWLARIKTHANWRTKVRTLPGLGDPYANWKLAESTTERCFSGPKGTVCQFSGIPCRRF